MVQEARNLEPSGLADELDGALTRLESALSEAGGAVRAIRGIIPQIAALVGVVDQMEAAMTRVRQQLSASARADSQAPMASPSLRPVPPGPSDYEASPIEPTVAAVPAEAQPANSVSHCLRIDVRSKDGSLDLRAVDRSVNESPAVVDVALLDYDGHHATLKVWVEAASTPAFVRGALLESLERHLAERGEAEVQIDFEEESGG